MGNKYTTILKYNNGELLKSANKYYWKHNNNILDCQLEITDYDNRTMDNVIIIHDDNQYTTKWSKFDSPYFIDIKVYYDKYGSFISRKDATFGNIPRIKRIGFYFKPSSIKIYKVSFNGLSFSFPVINIPINDNQGTVIIPDHIQW